MTAHQHTQRGLRDGALRPFGQERRGLLQGAPDDERRNHDDRAEPEGQSPAPREKLVGRQQGDGDEHTGGEDLPRLRSAHGEAREVCPSVIRRMLESHRVRARLLAPRGEPLQQTQDHEEDRRSGADLLVRRETSHDEGGDPHEQDGEHEDALATEPVAHVPEHQSTQRSREISDPERADRQHGREDRIGTAEEHLSEHERRGGPIDEEVVVLESTSDPGGRCRLSGVACRADGRVRVGRHRLLLVLHFEDICERTS
ncbi:hypothetical protein QE377_003348 [Microbacterium sp. SORGH_AS 862]|nr:hypothetical protein [Microbacterium sp. SORGH_AS_0862]